MKLKHALIQAACLAAALSANAVMAQTIRGGGASLPAFLYNAEIDQFASTTYLDYFSAGSGAGKNALTFNDAAQLNASLSGAVHYAGSDSILSSTDKSNFTAHSSVGGNLVQIPSVATPVGIPFKIAGVSSLQLNDDQLCGIFSGKITNWSSIIPSVNQPIEVAYRFDGSGTSEIFTRHLAAVCNGTNSNVTFAANTTFAANFTTIPSNFHAVELSDGIRNAVAGLTVTDKKGGGAGVPVTLSNAIGYLSPDYINTTLAPLSTAATQNLTAADLKNTTDGSFYQPTVANTATGAQSLALADGSLPSPTNVLHPLNNVDSWAVIAPTPAAGYPIVGVTFLDHVQCYSATNRPNILAFLNKHYDYSVTMGVESPTLQLIKGNGFAPLPDSLATLVRENLLANANSKNANIGNTTACLGKTAR